jgi:membrane fusion protein, multidrug efflux system
LPDIILKSISMIFYKNIFFIRRVPYVFLLIFILIFVSCGSGEQQSAQMARPTMAQGYKAQPQQFSIEIRSTGELLSYEDVVLRSPVAGNVMGIHFSEGQYVSEGTLLVEIDSRTWQAQKRGLEAQLVNAMSELERREALLEFEGASQQSVDQALAAVNDLKARIDELSVRIDLARIRAPFSGRLGMRNFSPGAFMGQGETITRLVQTQKLKINFDVPARYASLMQEGLMVNVISSSTGDTVAARVYAIEPVINASNRSLTVRGILENGLQKFFPGDFAQVFIEVDQTESALLIPTEAIISELNSQIVYVAHGGKAVRTEVEIGASTRGRVNILNGINEGDTVLITGLMTIRNGSDVVISSLNQEAGL